MVERIVSEYIRFSIIFGVVYTFVVSRSKTSSLRRDDGSLDKPWVVRWFILSVVIWPYLVIMALWWTVRDFIRDHKNRRKR